MYPLPTYGCAWQDQQDTSRNADFLIDLPISPHLHRNTARRDLGRNTAPSFNEASSARHWIPAFGAYQPFFGHTSIEYAIPIQYPFHQYFHREDANLDYHQFETWRARQPSPLATALPQARYWDEYSTCSTSSASPPPIDTGVAVEYDSCYDQSMPGSCGINPVETIHNSDSHWTDRYRISTPDPTDFESKLEHASYPLHDEPCWTPQPLPDELPPLTPHVRSSFSSADSESEYEPPSLVRHRAHVRQRAHTKVSKRQTSRLSKARQETKAEKIAKAPVHTKSISSSSDDRQGKENARHFSCPLLPYGCGATFATKNEWKRHLKAHLILEFYRCDLCQNSDENPNDFNRKDLFQQHLKRMHSDTLTQASLTRATKDAVSSTSGSPTSPITSSDHDDICTRCYVPVHDPPTKTFCVFCSETFEGANSCKQWLEHVGKHLAQLGKDKKAVEPSAVAWSSDEAFRDWLLAVGILVPMEQAGSWRLVESTLDIKTRAFAKKMKATTPRRNNDADGDAEK